MIPKCNGEFPWSILRDDEDGLVAQLVNLAGPNGVFVHPEAIIGEFVRMEGPCYVGPNAEIRHSAFLRKGSWICEGAIVGHSSEVKNSVLLPYSKAPHFNYVGDSIIGMGANLGAGVKISNIRNDKREVLVSLQDGSKIETGLTKMGALVGDHSQLGCNAVINPGAILPPYSMIPPNESVIGWWN
jgi:NDP-sugar pyrophosphorylase family protein